MRHNYYKWVVCSSLIVLSHVHEQNVFIITKNSNEGLSMYFKVSPDIQNRVFSYGGHTFRIVLDFYIGMKLQNKKSCEECFKCSLSLSVSIINAMNDQLNNLETLILFYFILFAGRVLPR